MMGHASRRPSRCIDLRRSAHIACNLAQSCHFAKHASREFCIYIYFYAFLHTFSDTLETEK